MKKLISEFNAFHIFNSIQICGGQNGTVNGSSISGGTTYLCWVQSLLRTHAIQAVPAKFLCALMVINLTTCYQKNEGIPYHVAFEKCKSNYDKKINFNVALLVSRSCLHDALIPQNEFITTRGEKINLSQLEENYALINFWFINCPPCIAEIPLLNEIDKRGKIKVIGIARDEEEDILNCVSCRGINYSQIAGGKTIIDSIFQLPFGYPSNFLIDTKQGKILKVFNQILPNSENMKMLLEL